MPEPSATDLLWRGTGDEGHVYLHLHLPVRLNVVPSECTLCKPRHAFDHEVQTTRDYGTTPVIIFCSPGSVSSNRTMSRGISTLTISTPL